MYQAGTLMVYGIHGVCRILGEEQRTVDRKKVNYLVLEPLGQGGSRFLVPAHSAAAMEKLRPLLRREELEEMLAPGALPEGTWIQDENRRKQRYRELIGSGDREGLLTVARSIARHKEAQAVAGRKCHLCDDNFLRDAVKLLSGEIAVVLEMDQEQAREYLRQKL